MCPGPAPRTVNCRRCSNWGQLGVCYNSGPCTGFLPSLSVVGRMGWLTGWQSCLNVGAQFSGHPGSWASHLLQFQRSLLFRKRQATTNKEALEMVPDTLLSPPGTPTGSFQGARQREGSPLPSPCAQPGLSQRYRLYR